MKIQSCIFLMTTLCFTFLMAQDDEAKGQTETGEQPVMVPHSPEDTSTGDSLLPSTATEAEKEAAAEKAKVEDISSGNNAMPAKTGPAGDPQSQLTMDIDADDAQAKGVSAEEHVVPAADAVAPVVAADASTEPAPATVEPAADGTDTAAATDATGSTDTTPAAQTGTESYAPDTSGLSVKEVQVSEPVVEAELDPGGKPKMAESSTTLPALEVDFPESGEVTLEFPTSEEQVTEAEMGTDDTISVDFPDEEVRTIIRNVADLYDLNVVIPDTLVGSTSVKLRNVSWRQVFEVVLQPLGYTYVEDRNIIKIRSQDELLQEPVDTRVFLINYAVAKNLQASLAPLIDAAAGGRIQVDERTNALIITERPSRMNDIQEIIERLDRPNPQVMIESKFIEVNDRNQENLGVNWTSLSGYRISAGPFQRDYSSESSAENLNNSTSTNNRSNTSTSTVTNGTATNTFTNTVGTTMSNALDIATAAGTSRIDTAVFSAPAFEWVLSALQTLSDSKLLTNPTLVTLDGEDAKLLIGDKYPIPNYTYNEERGTFEVSGFEYEDIGIVLTVRPQVNSAGFIRLDVNPQLSRRNGDVNFGGAGGATIPIINSTETQSSVILKDGYTLAIGGLIQDERVQTDNKVPWLGDIPGLGYFFKHEATTTDERNLIIFITAKTLNPDGTTYKDIIDQRMLYRMGITEADIPGMKLPDDHKQVMDDIFQMRSQVENDKLEEDLFEKQMALKVLQQAGVINGDGTTDDSSQKSPTDKRNAVSRAR